MRVEGERPGGVAALIGARSLIGAILVLYPAPLLRRLSGRPADRGTRVAARLLGARHLTEAALLRRHPTARRLYLGAAVDGIHAASMAVLARLSPRRRGPAAASALSAAVLAAAGVLAARRLG